MAKTAMEEVLDQLDEVRLQLQVRATTLEDLGHAFETIGNTSLSRRLWKMGSDALNESHTIRCATGAIVSIYAGAVDRGNKNMMEVALGRAGPTPKEIPPEREDS